MAEVGDRVMVFTLPDGSAFAITPSSATTTTPTTEAEPSERGTITLADDDFVEHTETITFVEMRFTEKPFPSFIAELDEVPDTFDYLLPQVSITGWVLDGGDYVGVSIYAYWPMRLGPSPRTFQWKMEGPGEPV